MRRCATSASLKARTCGSRCERPRAEPGCFPKKAAELVRVKVDLTVALADAVGQGSERSNERHPDRDGAGRRSARVRAALPAWRDREATSPGSRLRRPRRRSRPSSSFTRSSRLQGACPYSPNAAPISFTKPYLAQVEDGGRRTGLAIEAFLQRPDAPLEPAFEAMRAKAADALIVQGTMSRKEVVELAIKYRLASSGSQRTWPMAGGLSHIPQVLRRCMRWRRATSTRSSKGERPPICRSRSPRNSTWSST